MLLKTLDQHEFVERRDDLISSIGQTPLIRLSRIVGTVLTEVEVYAKAEHLNPGGSVKDRPALSMILDGIQSGKLTKDKILLDATSGNTGIAYAMIGAALGYRVTLCLPKNASIERKKILKIYGAEIIETSPLNGTDGAQIVAKEMAEKEPDKYFYPDQYNNDANWRAHYETTAPEIWKQTEGRVTHFVAGLGTSGTFMGTARRLKEFRPQIKVISMQPDSPMHGLEGMKHMETAIVPGIYDPTFADETIEVSTDDAMETMRRLAREEGLFVGVSAGANVFAAIEVAKRLPAGSVVVTVLCDTGSRYLSEDIWESPSKVPTFDI
jgi:S-sulfo-L-cysteine synthase (O-acetyl-L-serine-dependent)